MFEQPDAGNMIRIKNRTELIAHISEISKWPSEAKLRVLRLGADGELLGEHEISLTKPWSPDTSLVAELLKGCPKRTDEAVVLVRSGVLEDHDLTEDRALADAVLRECRYRDVTFLDYLVFGQEAIFSLVFGTSVPVPTSLRRLSEEQLTSY